MLRVVHLEDDPLDAELVREVLTSDGLPCAIALANDRSSFVAALAVKPDIVLADYSLPGFDGSSAQKIVQERWPDVPFVPSQRTAKPQRGNSSERACYCPVRKCKRGSRETTRSWLTAQPMHESEAEELATFAAKSLARGLRLRARHIDSVGGVKCAAPVVRLPAVDRVIANRIRTLL